MGIFSGVGHSLVLCKMLKCQRWDNISIIYVVWYDRLSLVYLMYFLHYLKETGNWMRKIQDGGAQMML